MIDYRALTPIDVVAGWDDMGLVKDPLRESAPLVFLAAIVMERRSTCSVTARQHAGEFGRAADRLCWDVVRRAVYHGCRCITEGCGVVKPSLRSG